MKRIFEVRSGYCPTISHGRFSNRSDAGEVVMLMKCREGKEARVVELDFGAVMDEYADRRKVLGQQYAGDGQGFYAADAILRSDLGLEWTDNNLQAMQSQARESRSLREYLEQQGDQLPF